MTPSAIEEFLLSLPGATLSIQWGELRVFKIAGKIFAIMGPKGERPARISFKAAEDSFHILTGAKHIVPAPYLARAHWVMLERLDALTSAELKAYLVRARALIVAGLPKAKRAALGLRQSGSEKKSLVRK
jgi:predicted DNA-binding protein (MmcQ/YjbR family)